MSRRPSVGQPPRVCLGMLARSDHDAEPWLDRVLAILTPCFDGVEIRYDEGRPIDDFAGARNEVISRAEARGLDWLIMLDSDECMFPADIELMRSRMTPERRLIVTPRYNFVADYAHYEPSAYPDYQRRVFRLGVGYRYRRRVHEGLFRRFSPLSEGRLRTGLVSDDTPIYHYGLVRPPAEMELKHVNYQRLARGEQPLEQLPPGHVVGDNWALSCGVPFTHPHPLADFDTNRAG